MSTQGIILIDLIGIGLLITILNFVRTRKLHVAYAVVWCLAVLGMMIIISVPPFLEALPVLLGAVYPASALSLLAFAFIFFFLILFSVQLSILTDRQEKLIQSLAIKEYQQRMNEGEQETEEEED